MFHFESWLILPPPVPENTDSRQESSHCLALTLDQISNVLMENLQRFIEMGDRNGVETIWTCCVTCLAHLTALSHLISQREPNLNWPMNDLCDLALDKLGDLCREVQVDVYSYFDFLTEVRILMRFLRTSKVLTKNAN